MPRLALILLLAAGFFAHTLPTLQVYGQAGSDPLGSFEGSGPPAPLNWTGDGQRIVNPSFETGLAPWVQIQSNAAAGSGAQANPPAIDGSLSALLTVQSANTTSESRMFLVADLTAAQIGFGASIRLRASLYVEQLTGVGPWDRAEVEITLSTSLGQTRTIHYYYGSSSVSDGPADAYFRITGVLGQWISLDRDVASDALARFPPDYPVLAAVREVSVSVFSRSVGVDPKIRYVDGNSNFSWNSGESVVYDTNSNRRFDSGEPVLSAPIPGNQALLQDDQRIRYVDLNSNNAWDTGEGAVFDTNNNNVYDSAEPVIVAPAPPIGTLFYRMTASRFDRIEVYSATGNFEWIPNEGFEGSLSGWGAYGGTFQAVTTRALKGAWSARGSVLGTMADMSVGLDARPEVESWSTFKASAYVETMSGTSAADYVDIWIGLVDNSPAGNLAFIHYLFKTGDGSVPTNTTNALYHEVGGFGILNRWLNVSSSLQQEVSSFSTTVYTLPFHLVSVVVETSAQSSFQTTAYFDELSLHGPYHPGPFISGSASSYRYADDGRNSTYVYIAASIPHGAFYLVIPRGQSVLNITGPGGGMLQQGDYATSPLTGRIDVLDIASFKHPPLGDWRITTTSANAVSQVYAEDETTKAQRISVNPGTVVNLVSNSRDPFGDPLSLASVSLTIWTTNGVLVGTPGTGQTSNLGWFNATGVNLASAGVFKIQATSLSPSYVGVRTFQVSVLYALAVSISLSTTQLITGTQVTISGSVSPSRQGVTVTIQYRPAGTSDWTDLASPQTDADGAYSYDWKPFEGVYQIRVITNDPQVEPAESFRAQITVSPTTLPIVILALVAAAIAGLGLAIVFLRRRSQVGKRDGLISQKGKTKFLRRTSDTLLDDGHLGPGRQSPVS